MITKQDCLLLLTELQKHGIDTTQYIKKAVSNSSVDLETLKFINDNRPLEIVAFYEKLRKSYNHKKSSLYKNIMKDLDEENISEVLTTVASLQLQILLFSKYVDNPETFLKHSRLEEIALCLVSYAKTYSLINCIQLLRLVKADIKALESISR